MPTTRIHPLRRISTGSLTSLARSQDRASQSTASSGLDFLQPALTDLADEAATLASNIQRMTQLHDALGTFNESFAAYMYAMKMNAFCVEWPEAPDEHSFARAASLVPPAPPSTTSQTPQRVTANTVSGAPQQQAAYDTTYATIYSNTAMDDSPPPPPRGAANVAGARGRGAAAGGRGGSGGAASGIARKKPGMTLAEKRKRDAAIAAIIEVMPLEYRGSQPATRVCMEKVLTELMAHPEGRKLNDIVKPPELTQAKVNKCMIALVNKKIVSKTAIAGVTNYKLA